MIELKRKIQQLQKEVDDIKAQTNKSPLRIEPAPMSIPTADLRRAITTQTAPADTKITANLYDNRGKEITSGKGAGINVYCLISGGGNLNEAIRLLADNTNIIVVKLPYDNEGTPEDRWWCVEGFQTFDTDHFQITGGKLQDTLFSCT